MSTLLLQVGDLETIYREAVRQANVLEKEFFSLDSKIICRQNNIEEGYDEYEFGLAELIQERNALRAELREAKIKAVNLLSEKQYLLFVKTGVPLPSDFLKRMSPKSQS